MLRSVGSMASGTADAVESAQCNRFAAQGMARRPQAAQLGRCHQALTATARLPLRSRIRRRPEASRYWDVRRVHRKTGLQPEIHGVVRHHLPQNVSAGRILEQRTRAAVLTTDAVIRLVGAAGLEPATVGLEIRCSIRLSYAPVRG